MPIHFTADKKTLVSLIQPTMTAVSSRNTLPALEGLLFTLQGNELSVCGYDLEKGDTKAAIEKLEKAANGRFSPLNYKTKAEIEQELATLRG